MAGSTLQNMHDLFANTGLPVGVRAFTLIELMIVVAIVGVLSAIAIPLFNEYRGRANDASAEADAKTYTVVLTLALKG